MFVIRTDSKESFVRRGKETAQVVLYVLICYIKKSFQRVFWQQNQLIHSLSPDLYHHHHYMKAITLSRLDLRGPAEKLYYIYIL